MWSFGIHSDIPAEQTEGIHNHLPESVKPDKIKVNFNQNLKLNDKATFGSLWLRSATWGECPCVCLWMLVHTSIRCVHIPLIRISFGACFHNPMLFLHVDTNAILITLRGRFTIWCHSAKDTCSHTEAFLHLTLFIHINPSIFKSLCLKIRMGFLNNLDFLNPSY
jgi:hypothetical protein